MKLNKDQKSALKEIDTQIREASEEAEEYAELIKTTKVTLKKMSSVLKNVSGELRYQVLEDFESELYDLQCAVRAFKEYIDDLKHERRENIKYWKSKEYKERA